MRTRVGVLIILTVLVGLLSRSQFALQIIPLGVGDALYGTMIYLLVRWILIERRPRDIFWFASTFCVVIEFSQLITVDWFETLRISLVGKLILGNNFRLADLVYLAIGVAGGMVIDLKYVRRDLKTVEGN